MHGKLSDKTEIFELILSFLNHSLKQICEKNLNEEINQTKN